APTPTSTLSLHDALPISSLDYVVRLDGLPAANRTTRIVERSAWPRLGGSPAYVAAALVAAGERMATPVTWIGKDTAGERFLAGRSEEHTSELQSLAYLVC